MGKSVRIFLLIIIILISKDLNSKDRYTDYIIFGGGSINLNIHSTDFNSFSGCPSCATDFDGGIGFGPNLTIGAIHLPESRIFDKKWQYGLALSYSDLPATMTREEFIGYVIYDDSYVDGKSEFTLEGNFAVILISPFIEIFPVDILPLRLNLGLESGVFINSSFKHQEKLLSPSGATFENYKRIRQEFSGDIPEAASLYIAGRIGTSYEIYSFDNFKIVPHINYSYGFTDFTDEVNWSSSRISAGVNLEYRIPAPASPAPVPPPPPPLPEPELPEPLAVDVKLRAISGDRKEYEDGDTIQVQVLIHLEKDMIGINPALFLMDEKGISLNKNGDRNSFTKAYFIAQNLLIQAIAENMLNSDQKLRITASYADKKAEIENKVSSFVNELNTFGIDKSRIDIEYIDLSSKKYPYPELKEEANNLQFSFPDSQKLLYITAGIKQNISIEEKTLQIISIPNKDDIINTDYFSSKGKVRGDGSITLDSSDLNPVINDNMMISFGANVTDKNLQKSEASMSITFGKSLEGKETIQESLEEQSREPLGYFNFDEYTFDVIDQRVLQDAKSAIKNGKKLILYAYTDNLGSIEYNNNLAKKRADSALKLLNVDPSKVEIRYPKIPPFNNDTPLGRKLNRSVFIEVK